MNPQSMREIDAAQVLQRLNRERVAAVNKLTAAEAAVETANVEYIRAEARYKRQALWIRADELRSTLAEVENEVANIHIPKEDA